MKSILFSIAICILISSSTLCAQGQAAVPFINLFLPSANLNAVAGVFTALPTNDPFGFLYNPAQLGQFSQNTNGAIQFDQRKYTLFPDDDMYIFDIGFSLGYNFNKLNNRLPLSIGAGYMLGYLSWGENIWTDETGSELGKYDSREYYNAFGIGGCYDSFIKTSIGITYKRIVSDLGPSYSIVGNEQVNNKSEGNAFDFGLHINIPFTDLFRKDKINNFHIYPIIDLNFGYAIVNMGDEMHYIDINQADPLPRQARLGNAIRLGLGMCSNGVDLNIFTFEYSSEANDLLVKRDTTGASDYQGLFGDLNVLNSLLLTDDKDKVDVRRGLRLNIYEVLQLSLGFYDRPSHSQVKPFGVKVSLKGIFKTITMFSKVNAKNFINHFDVQFSYTNLNLNSGSYIYEDDFWGLQFAVYGY